MKKITIAYHSLIKCIKSDFIKLKNSSFILISLGGAIVMPLLVFLMYYLKPTHFIPKEGVNSWFELINSSLLNISFFILPFYIILASSLVHSIEHKSSSWKNLLILPHSRQTFYLSKLFILLISIGLTYLCFSIMIVTSGLILNQVHIDLKLTLDKIPFNFLANFLLHSFLSILGILSLHNALSLLIKNQIIVISVGTMFTVIAAIAYLHGKMIYFPYSYPILTLYDLTGDLTAKKSGIMSTHEIYSILYFITFNIIGIYFFNKKEIK